MMTGFHYVYIVESQSHPERYYIGFTEDLEDRLKRHNAGAVPSTEANCPWTYRTCTAFKNRQRAIEYERYLKTHSGRAFLAKHL
jgi:putative endonuclease